MRVLCAARSLPNRFNSRCSRRASSAAALGTRTTPHTFFSPAAWRISNRSSFFTSSRSVFARRWRRETSMLDGSTTTFSYPASASQRASQKPSRPAS